MAQVPLVENQIEDGKKLVERLVHEGVSVTAAFWAKTSDDGQWYLYLVVPGVEEQGKGDVYLRIIQEIRRLPQPFGVHPFEVKVIGLTDALAHGVQEFQRRYPTRNGTQYNGEQLGGVSVEGAYVYPVLAPATGQ